MKFPFQIPDQVGHDDFGVGDDVLPPKNPSQQALLLFLRHSPQVLVIFPPGPAVADHFVDGTPVGEAADGAVVDEEVGVELAGVDGRCIDFFAGVVGVDGEEFEASLGAEVYGFLQEVAFTGGPEDETMAFGLDSSE